jgi:L-ascorbate metabolism protein UlaG (beta-lactamase superfamily)
VNKGGTVEVVGIEVTMVTADHSAGDIYAGAEATIYLGSGRIHHRDGERLPRLLRGRH